MTGTDASHIAWAKGGGFVPAIVLALASICADCDHDTLLVQAMSQGSTCPLGISGCFGGDVRPSLHATGLTQAGNDLDNR